MARVAGKVGPDERISATRVEEELEERLGLSGFAQQKRLCKYLNGSASPNETTLTLIERSYPGTRAVFDQGPDCSLLWVAIEHSEPAAVLEEIKRELRKGRQLDDCRLFGQLPLVKSFRMPATLERQLGLHKMDDDAMYLWFKKNREQLQRTQNAFGTVCDAGFFAHYAEGPLVDLDYEITLTPLERLRGGQRIMPSVLMALSIQIANARFHDVQDVDLKRQAEIEGRLRHFGLTLENISGATGLRFPKQVVIQQRASTISESRGDGVTRPGVRIELPPSVVNLPAPNGTVDQIPGPSSIEIAPARRLPEGSVLANIGNRHTSAQYDHRIDAIDLAFDRPGLSPQQVMRIPLRSPEAAELRTDTDSTTNARKRSRTRRTNNGRE